jgi:iron(III) transport system substrate-binding protein
MQRRRFIQSMAALAAAGALPFNISTVAAAISANDLPELKGELNLYLGRGEGGLYESVIKAIEQYNPELKLRIRRGPTASLANALLAEAKAGVKRADLFWAVDSGAIGMLTEEGLAKPLPSDLTGQLHQSFQFPDWTPVTGRVRTIPFNTERLKAEDIPDDIMALADSDFKIGWAPAYASFQSFVTAMRILKGDKVTSDWLRGVDARAKKFAGELGVVMAVERGEVDLGLANHYYSLRLKSGKPDARVDLAFTRNDAGCLVNASGILALSDGDLPVNFIRYLLSQEVQSYLAEQAYEIPLVDGVKPPAGLPSLDRISPPEMDLTKLADLRPTIDLMRNVGIL